MKLETFIRDTLVAIGKGITDANRVFQAPHPFHLASDTKRHIDFEIVLVVEGQRTKSAGGKIRVWVAQVQGGAQATTSDKHTHIVKFSVNASERSEFIAPRRRLK